MEGDGEGGASNRGWTNPSWLVVVATWTKVKDMTKGLVHSQRKAHTTKIGYNNSTSSFNNPL